MLYECLEQPQIWLTALSYAQPDDYLRLLKNGSKLKKNIRVIFLISTVAGKLANINSLNIIKNLKTFYDIKIRLNNSVSITTDYDTSPGLIYLCHEDEAAIEKDFLTIRELEKNMYEVF